MQFWSLCLSWSNGCGWSSLCDFQASYLLTSVSSPFHYYHSRYIPTLASIYDWNFLSFQFCHGDFISFQSLFFFFLFIKIKVMDHSCIFPFHLFNFSPHLTSVLCCLNSLKFMSDSSKVIYF